MLFFFQAEDGIRDVAVTGVQTCALPISWFRRLVCSIAPRSAAGRFAPPNSRPARRAARDRVYPRRPSILLQKVLRLLSFFEGTTARAAQYCRKRTHSDATHKMIG